MDFSDLSNVTCHVLHVDTDFDPDNPGWCFELWHPDSCPTETETFLGVECVSHECLEAEVVADLGPEGFFRHVDDPRVDGREVLEPGRYAIEGWVTKYPATPDHGEEWDAGLGLIPEVTP